MGTTLKTYCKCGYETVTVSGSSRANHGKVFKFPHLCRNCNNAVSVDLLAQTACCPLCDSTDIESYAAKTVLTTNKLLCLLGHEILSKRGYHVREEEFSDDFCYVLDKHLVLLRKGNECPSCHESTLQFFTEMMFD